MMISSREYLKGPDFSLGEEFAKAFKEYLLIVINEPVRPGSIRSLVGEDRLTRMYSFPMTFNKGNTNEPDTKTN